MSVTNGNASLPAAAGGGGAAAYLSEYQVGPSGAILKFVKGQYVTATNGTVIPEGTEMTCIYDQTQAGWIKFNGEGSAPTRHMGAIFSGYVPPKRESLNDLDQDFWPKGLDGKPQDPWQHQLMLALVNADGEKYIFTTSSITGRGAVSKLLNLCTRLQRTEPNHYPVIRLKLSGFDHRDPRVGWVATPAFEVVGKALRDNVESGKLSLKEDAGDSVPF